MVHVQFTDSASSRSGHGTSRSVGTRRSAKRDRFPRWRGRPQPWDGELRSADTRGHTVTIPWSRGPRRPKTSPLYRVLAYSLHRARAGPGEARRKESAPRPGALRGRGAHHRVRHRASGGEAHPPASRAAWGGRPGRTMSGSVGGSVLRARAWWVGEGRASEGERAWARPLQPHG